MTENRSAEHQITERIKELQALYSLSALTEREDITLNELYQEVANILPQSWQYPEIACARIVIGDRAFRTENFAQSPWRQSAPIKVHGSVVGGIDVGYLKEQPEQDEGPFLKDERRLLNAIAERLGHITRRKQVEEELRESERRLIEAQHIGKIGNWEWFPAENKVIWSGEMYDIFGIAPETVLTMEMSIQAFHPEDRAMVEESTRRTLTELKPQLIECRVLKPDGTIGYVHGRSEVVLDANGKLVRIIGIYQDITERKQLEAAQQESNELAVNKQATGDASEFAESVINTVREPLIALDQDLRVVSVNRSFYEFFQVKPEETVGQLIYDLGNKQWDIPKLRELLETILPQETTFDNYEVEHDFATIGRRIMLLNARQIQRGLGKARIILLAIEDITKRKQIEAGLETAHEELKELASELKRAARAKSEFLANMSHELRTPLNSINGFAEVLFDETFGPLNEKQRQYVNNVLTSGRHLRLLINQILDMAQVEAGKMKLALSSIPMKSLLNELSMLVADMVSKKKIEMLLEIAEDLPNIVADELKVREIIYNLLSNAVKFTPDGGQIGMRAKKVDSVIEIVVWDTGVGIAPENIGKVFEGFFRVDTPYSRVTEGTGLGLALSRKLVELHGGTLFIESEGLNKGTSVRFILPMAPKMVA
jgi:two-component system, cell cycle sensor histidine kinase PleC